MPPFRHPLATGECFRCWGLSIRRSGWLKRWPGVGFRRPHSRSGSISGDYWGLRICFVFLCVYDTCGWSIHIHNGDDSRSPPLDCPVPWPSRQSNHRFLMYPRFGLSHTSAPISTGRSPDLGSLARRSPGSRSWARRCSFECWGRSHTDSSGVTPTYLSRGRDGEPTQHLPIDVRRDVDLRKLFRLSELGARNGLMSHWCSIVGPISFMCFQPSAGRPIDTGRDGAFLHRTMPDWLTGRITLVTSGLPIANPGWVVHRRESESARVVAAVWGGDRDMGKLPPGHRYRHPRSWPLGAAVAVPPGPLDVRLNI